MTRILIAEDERPISTFLEKGLRAAGFATTVIDEGRAALALARTGEFDLLVLDLGLPELDGLDVLRALREEDRSLPVVILSARDDTADKIAGLELGADDYVTKPFAFAELLARVRARLRDTGTAEVLTLAVGTLALDLRTRRVTGPAGEVSVTAREFTMLETFMRHPDQVLSREQLLSHVWGYDHDPGSNVVDVYVRNLRKKLGAQAIETVRGVGYRLAV